MTNRKICVRTFLGSWNLYIFFVVFCLMSTMASALEEFEKTSQDFLEKYCLRCHDSSKQKGKFRIDNLSSDFNNHSIAEKWNEVRFRISASEMPPEDEIQPTAEEIGNIVDKLTQKIREGSAVRMAQRASMEYYRLSREEYAHTIYDLLGVVYDVEAPGALNEDPRWRGFNRLGALLSLIHI